MAVLQLPEKTEKEVHQRRRCRDSGRRRKLRKGETGEGRERERERERESERERERERESERERHEMEVQHKGLVRMVVAMAGGCGGSGCSKEREWGKSCRGARKKKGSRNWNPK